VRLPQGFKRKSGSKSSKDGRDPAQKDRDRILYTAALRRLAGVTQVVGAVEGHVYHNRLTHTLEVAQIARGLAERLCSRHKALRDKSSPDFVSPTVVEAAALAHDLGHPPFGHVAEETLRECVGQDAGGFEGNAQSFRIITKLAAHRTAYKGLDLTRATLNATLKYPWMNLDPSAPRQDKFGAYQTEADEFAWTRQSSSGYERTLEASIMDYADDIAYSVHDVDDFFRAGLIPLHDPQAMLDRGEFADFQKSARFPKGTSVNVARRTVTKRLKGFPIQGPYTGTYEERAKYRTLSSRLIDDFISSPTIVKQGGQSVLRPNDEHLVQIAFLKNLVWKYVIENDRLATQQQGQITTIKGLFQIYMSAILDRKSGKALLPPTFATEWELQDLARWGGDKCQHDRGVRRLAADVIASFTDHQATVMYHRLTGVSSGSVHDRLWG
jgi:dGTPase